MIYRPRVTVNTQTARNVQLTGSTTFPWRPAEFRSQNELSEMQITMEVEDSETRVFQVKVNDPGAHVCDQGTAKARGLPEWRKVIPPRSFEDGKLETILKYMTDHCGGKFSLKTKGIHQHTCVIQQGTAYQLVQQVLTS